MLIYYVLDDEGRIIFKGQSLTVALSICHMFEKYGMETILAVERPQIVNS